MSFAILNTPDEVAALPDGTLITWLPVLDDPSSEACAFVRKAGHETGDQTTWIAPGNGWEPESLDVLVFPVRVVLRVENFNGYGPDADPDDVAPELLEPQWATLDSGGTYPRDVALQAAATLFAGQDRLSANLVINFAETFAAWLDQSPVHDDQIEPISLGDHD